ncbi:Synaptotagmin-17, partial [Stegodyphus mimosarum]
MQHKSTTIPYERVYNDQNTMKWIRCCYCCCCWSSPTEKTSTFDDASSLIQEGQTPNHTGETEVQTFYVPRRHSSFNTGTYNTVATQPGRSQSDSCSSSGDDDIPPIEQRGRCWSTIPATSATDVTSLISNRSSTGRESNVILNSRPVVQHDIETGREKNSFIFDKHVLSGIAETESVEEEQEEVETERNEKEGGTQVAPKTDSEVYGYLTFVTAYDEQEQRFTVFLEKASDLPRKGTLHHYSTFVKLSISSNRKNFRLSRTAKNSLNPVFKEEHVFHTNRSKWKSTKQNVLRLSLFDCDRQGRHDAVGHAVLPLASLNSDKEDQHCLPLTPMSIPVQNIGQMLVGLFYAATQSRLSIHVIKAKHLRLDPDVHKRHTRPLNKEVFDTFAKVSLMCGGQKVKTNRSRVVVDSTDPFYNHKSDFVVPPQFLLDSSLVVTVMVRGVLGRSFPLGRITAGPYTEKSNGTLTHWGRMVQDSRSVVQWRNLYL